MNESSLSGSLKSLSEELRLVPTQSFMQQFKHNPRPYPSYLWRTCWAAVPPCAGSTAGPPGWRSPSSSGSWWWAGWWRPCPAGWWWRPAAATSWPVRKTQSSPSPAAIAPRPATSPSSEPAAWTEGKEQQSVIHSRLPFERDETSLEQKTNNIMHQQSMYEGWKLLQQQKKWDNLKRLGDHGRQILKTTIKLNSAKSKNVFCKFSSSRSKLF